MAIPLWLEASINANAAHNRWIERYRELGGHKVADLKDAQMTEAAKTKLAAKTVLEGIDVTDESIPAEIRQYVAFGVAFGDACERKYQGHPAGELLVSLMYKAQTEAWKSILDLAPTWEAEWRASQQVAA